MAFLRNRSFMIGATLVAIFIGAALISFLWTPFDVTKLDIPNKLQTPSAIHWFGTDHFGRDIFSMIMVGARTSIAVAVLAVGIGIILGVPLGLAAAAGRVPPELLRCRGQGPPRRQQPRHRRRYGCRSRAPQSNRTRNHRRAQSYRQRLRRPCQSPPSRYRHRHLLRVRARVGLLRLSVSPAVSGCAVRSENWNSKCAELRRLLAARVDAQIAFSKENARRVCAVLRRRYRSRSYGRLRGCRVCEVGGPVVLTLKPARAGSATCDVHSISHAR